jgi:hypothetical protein
LCPRKRMGGESVGNPQPDSCPHNRVVESSWEEPWCGHKPVILASDTPLTQVWNEIIFETSSDSCRNPDAFSIKIDFYELQ